MKLELSVHGEFIAELFLPDYADETRRIRKHRLNRHVILVNKIIRDDWEEELKKQNVFELYRDWMTQAIASQNTNLKMMKNPLVLPTEDVFIATAKKAEMPIVIGNYSSSSIANHMSIRFCDGDKLGCQKLNIINLNHVQELERKGGKLKDLFSIFETPIHLQVTENKSSQLLADYLACFYEGNSMIVQDLFFLTNESNFKKYIFPQISNGCKLTIILSTEDGAAHKKRIEKKYSATVKCYNKNLLHESFIETEHYRISIGYRLNIFGEDGKTNRELINIVHKN